MTIQKPYRLPELKEKISSGEYGAELMLQHAMLIIDEYRNQCITDTARIATLESQLRVITDDRDGWAKQCSDRIDDALAFAKESDARGEEIKALKCNIEKTKEHFFDVVSQFEKFRNDVQNSMDSINNKANSVLKTIGGNHE